MKEKLNIEDKGIDCKNKPYQRLYKYKGKDYTNFTQNYLTFLFPVKRLDIEDKKHSYWLAKCKCDNIIIIRTDRIKSKKPQSCGCLAINNIKKSLTKNLTGQKFGKLTAIKQVDNGKKGVHWLCKCECGKEIITLRSSLVSGGTKSCGCISSFKEEEITDILTELNINFKRQYRDNKCKDKNPLPFDFIIYKNDKYGLIEYQGCQHYKLKTHWDNEETFLIRQKHDKIKKEFCIDNNIPFLELNKTSNLKQDIIQFYNSF